MSLRETQSSETRAQSPIAAFQGDISPTNVAFSYRLGLFLVAIAMLILPAIYLSLIGLAGYGIYWHAANDADILTGRHRASFGTLCLYVAPMLAGVVLILFMIKPFFAPRAKRAKSYSVSRDEEPLLFEFIETICDRVKAPKPSRVDLDCQVNASASFRRGLLSLAGNDIVLTIGLPLVAGLSLKQFAGVLAHEFGHFAQGAGMRLTYLIRSISFWFMRVVYERDAWDAYLEHYAKNSDFRIMILLNLARLAVWLSRRILWALMMTGNALSCFMLRQMEFDADSYEAKLVGSDTFGTTARRLRELNLGHQAALQDAQSGWSSKRLPEDLPALAHLRASRLDPSHQEALGREIEIARTRTFDTHPCDRDRMKAAEALSERGIFHWEGGASVVFKDFKNVSRALTRHFYEHECELPVQEAALVSFEEAHREADAQKAAAESARRFLGELPLIHFEFLLESQISNSALDATTLQSEWKNAVLECERLKPEAEACFPAINKNDEALRGNFTGEWLARAQFRYEAKDFHILKDLAESLGNLEDAAIRSQAVHRQKRDEQIQKVQPFIHATCRRLTLALQLQPNGPEQPEGSTGDERATLIEVIRTLGRCLPALHFIRERWDALLGMLQNQKNHSNPAQVNERITSLLESFEKQRQQVQEILAGLPYPFPHARPGISLFEYASDVTKSDSRNETLFKLSALMLERLFELYSISVCRLVRLAEEREQWEDMRAQSPTASASQATSNGEREPSP